jgi:peptide chain release factor subunit 1
MSTPNGTDAEKNIEIWKVKKLIKRLEAARGNGTSMISLIIRELSDCCLLFEEC